MFDPTFNVVQGRVLMTRDGRISPFSQPEPEFLRRRYEHAEALRQANRENRIREVLAGESRGVVERIRIALGLA